MWPSLDTLQPLVNNIIRAYVEKQATLPVTDILVRVPASTNAFEGSVCKVSRISHYPKAS